MRRCEGERAAECVLRFAVTLDRGEGVAEFERVQQAITLNQFYHAEGPSDYVFDDIVYRDILVSLNAPLYEGPAVELSCSESRGKANCDVTMQDVRFVGAERADIACKGTVGVAQGVEGLHGVEDCLKQTSA